MEGILRSAPQLKRKALGRRSDADARSLSKYAHARSGAAAPCRGQRILGVIGLSGAAVLLFRKSPQLLAGNIDTVGTGFVANLTLVVGSLMFLREAQLVRSQPRPNEEL
jgi:hypothetical protein